jgi:hypothetical protein
VRLTSETRSSWTKKQKNGTPHSPSPNSAEVQVHVATNLSAETRDVAKARILGPAEDKLPTDSEASTKAEAGTKLLANSQQVKPTGTSDVLLDLRDVTNGNVATQAHATARVMPSSARNADGVQAVFSRLWTQVDDVLAQATHGQSFFQQHIILGVTGILAVFVVFVVWGFSAPPDSPRPRRVSISVGAPMVYSASDPAALHDPAKQTELEESSEGSEGKPGSYNATVGLTRSEPARKNTATLRAEGAVFAMGSEVSSPENSWPVSRMRPSVPLDAAAILGRRETRSLSDWYAVVHTETEPMPEVTEAMTSPAGFGTCS